MPHDDPGEHPPPSKEHALALAVKHSPRQQDLQAALQGPPEGAVGLLAEGMTCYAASMDWLIHALGLGWRSTDRKGAVILTFQGQEREVCAGANHGATAQALHRGVLLLMDDAYQALTGRPLTTDPKETP